METVADDALSLAEGTATGVDEAGAALWGLTKDVAVWATDLVLRQALAPVHEYRTSAKRVQAALDEEQAALPQTSTPSRSSVEKGVLVESVYFRLFAISISTSETRPRMRAIAGG